MKLRARRAEPRDQFVHGFFIQVLNDESNQQLPNNNLRFIRQHAVNSLVLVYRAPGSDLPNSRMQLSFEGCGGSRKI
jgi:hypothetical protein